MTSTPTAALDADTEADLKALRIIADILNELWCEQGRNDPNHPLLANESTVRKAESRLRSTLRAQDERIEALEQEVQRLSQPGPAQ